MGLSNLCILKTQRYLARLMDCDSFLPGPDCFSQVSFEYLMLVVNFTPHLLIQYDGHIFDGVYSKNSKILYQT